MSRDRMPPGIFQANLGQDFFLTLSRNEGSQLGLGDQWARLRRNRLGDGGCFAAPCRKVAKRRIFDD